MALLGPAALFAAVGAVFLTMALRFRRGRADHLLHQPYQQSLWPAARRSIPWGLLPISGICFLLAASMAVQTAGLGGPLASGLFLLLFLALAVTLVVFMVKKPTWLSPPDVQRRQVIEGAMDMDPADVPPRPIAEMTSQELAD
ncbi:MAG: hypothetical protein WA890_00835 [Micromonospora sp.]